MSYFAVTVHVGDPREYTILEWYLEYSLGGQRPLTYDTSEH